ncbi:hypothetical protein PR202_ga07990 [Eleusine coracana subsp. coracana]|uniref:[RNA-polymerase]-subunit kinase n=1 Tax=Eleusine coracana subsp. coracana TaxID=191504 RepID=A0AAV5C027_ELECO|nr:hypothetical protein PR202_ga07990 [Eleusine coracana subsp. coracana]
MCSLSLVGGGPASEAKQAARPEPTARGASEKRTTTTAARSASASAMGDGRASGGGSNRPAWLQQYELVGKIGEGTYGLVFLARLKPAHPAPGRRGPPIAIKKFKQSKEGDGVSPTAIREIMLLREINHENVVKLVNVHINHADMSLYLAFDYAEHDLYEIIRHHREKLSAPINQYTIKSLLWQLLNGLNYLHSENPGLHNIVHLPQKSPAFDLLSKMLEYDPRKRITAAQALEHEYFRMDPLPGRKECSSRKSIGAETHAKTNATTHGGDARVPAGANMAAFNAASQAGMAGLNPGNIPMQRGQGGQSHPHQLRRKADQGMGMQNPGYPQQKRRF